MEQMEKKQECACGCGCAEAAGGEVEVKKSEAPRRAYAPAVDIVEGKDAVELVVDVPGVAEGGVELNLEKDVLTLSAVPADGVIAGKKLMYSEYGVGEYRRSFTLSDEVDRENIAASLKNGVLRITLPKTHPVSRKIAVSAS